MDIHKNARTTPRSRAEIVRRIVERHEPVAAVARAFGVSERTARKWVARHQSEGPAGLADRSCRPHRSPRVTPAAVVAQVEALRRQRWTGARIAPAVALSRATVGRILRRRGLARLRQLEPVVPVRRYERARPGELLHVDIKKLGRIAGIGHRITGDRRQRAASAGSTSTWPSMTAAAWPMPRSCSMSGARRSRRSCTGPSGGMPAGVSGSSA